MKKLLIGLLTFSSLSLLAPAQAQAGLLFINEAFDYGEEPVLTFLSGIGMTGLGVYMITQGPLEAWKIAGGSLLIILDTENSANQNMLENKFSELYPFIDNAEVIKNLAKLVKNKIPEHSAKDQFISLSEEETRSVLHTSDLTPEQLNKVVNDLL